MSLVSLVSLPEASANRWSRRAALALLAVSLPLGAQETVDTVAIDKIKDEGFNRSQVMDIASWLTDVYGARLTNSPNIRKAGEWAVKTMSGWGLEKARLEAWGPFGRGWQNDFTAVNVLSPTPFPVIAYPAAWTPGTEGAVTAEVVALPPNAALAALEPFRGMLKGKVVFTMAAPQLKAHFTPDGRRYTDEDLDKMAAASPPAANSGGLDFPPAMMEAMRKRRETQKAMNQFMQDEGVAATILVGRGDFGTVFNAGGGSRDPKSPTTIPQVVLAAEHYGRIQRMLEKKIPVTMQLDIRNSFYDSDLDSFNVVAELPGTDARLKNEVVMLGAHFDSWQAGTGATDNAAGSAVMMEALRILKASGLPLKRTVRIGLWTGEEQGLLGSRAYVKAHFADPETMVPKPEHGKFSGYFNVDNGTGKIRGIYLQGNTAAGPIFREWLVPFASLGAKTITPSNTGGTDHQAFDGVGLPGFQFIQDDVEYNTRTHHSNMDVFERLQTDDMKHNAVVVAAFVYQTANRPEKLPRKAMPLPVKLPVF